MYTQIVAMLLPTAKLVRGKQNAQRPKRHTPKKKKEKKEAAGSEDNNPKLRHKTKQRIP